MLIASRRLKLDSSTDHADVTVDIFMPEMVDGLWPCRYQICWPSDKKTSAAHGVDAVQALFLALQKIGIEIYTSGYHKSGDLVWIKPGQGYGFPVSKNVRDLLIGADVDL